MTYKPENIESYKGEQIIINSGRLILNAKDDSIFNYTNKAFIVSVGDSIHFNVGPTDNATSNNKFIVNAQKIELGLNASEPILLGNETTNLLKEIIQDLQTFCGSLTSAVGIGVGSVALPQINIAATTLSTSLSTKISRLEKIKSLKNFTQ
jgi:hypothetical protein